MSYRIETIGDNDHDGSKTVLLQGEGRIITVTNLRNPGDHVTHAQMKASLAAELRQVLAHASVNVVA